MGEVKSTEQASRNNKTLRAIAIGLLALISVICVGVALYFVATSIRDKNARRVSEDIVSILADMEKNNAELLVIGVDGMGSMIVNASGEAYMEYQSTSGDIGQMAFLANGNVVQLSDGLKAEKGKSPLKVMEHTAYAVNMATGTDSSSEIVCGIVKGYNKVKEVLDTAGIDGEQRLIQLGATEDNRDDVSIYLYARKGVYVESEKTYNDEATTAEIYENATLQFGDTPGFATLSMFIKVGAKTYKMYDIKTVSTSPSVMSLGTEIYKCTPYSSFTTEESFRIAQETVQNVIDSCGIVVESEEGSE